MKLQQEETVTFDCPWPGCDETFTKPKEKIEHKAFKVNCPRCGRGLKKRSFR